MSAFEFAFTLFGLVLGLAMAEVLAGFVRVLKARTKSADETQRIRIGWLTPAVGLLVVLDLISTWLLAWSAGKDIPIGFPSLIFGTALTAIYYVAASLVWPDELAEWPDLDDWFDRHKAQIAGAIAAANVGFVSVQLVTGVADVSTLAAQFVYIALAAALALTHRRWQSGAVMAAMVGIIAVYAVGVI